MLVEAEANNPKFSFLRSNDLYRPYYDQKINDYIEEIVDEHNATTAPQPEAAQVLYEQKAQIHNAPKLSKPVTAPPPDQYSVHHPFVSLVDR